MLIVFKDKPERLAAFLQENTEACGRLQEWGRQVEVDLGTAPKAPGQASQEQTVRVEPDLFAQSRVLY